MGWSEGLNGPAYVRGITLPVVGAPYANADGSNRRFEIMLCNPGEAVELLPEPKNKHDRYAVAVVSARKIQIGYLPADRAPWIGDMIRAGREMVAIFQQATKHGASVRIAFDGNVPVLPVAAAEPPRPEPDDTGFWPDEIPPDE